jgi:hypothetical protein
MGARRRQESILALTSCLAAASHAAPAIRTRIALPLRTRTFPMNTTTTDLVPVRLRPALAGLFFAVLTLVYGFSMGIAFGVNEDAVKNRLKVRATAVKDTVYKGDDAAIKAMIDRGWVYLQRAHMHAGGIGASSVALILAATFVGTSTAMVRVASLALGLGGLGYSSYWMFAAFRAASLGNTTAAKESLKWLAMSSSGAVVIGTLVVLVMVAAACFRRPVAVAP